MNKKTKVLKEKLEYQSPQLEITLFSIEDEITTSIDIENFGGWLPEWN